MDQHVLQGTNMDQPQTNIQLQGILIIFINNLSPVLPLPRSPSPPLPSLPITLQAPHNRGRGVPPSGFGLTEKYPYFYASNPFQWSVLIRCNLADSSSPKLAKSLQTDHTFKRIHYTDLHFFRKQENQNENVWEGFHVIEQQLLILGNNNVLWHTLTDIKCCYNTNLSRQVQLLFIVLLTICLSNAEVE